MILLHARVANHALFKNHITAFASIGMLIVTCKLPLFRYEILWKVNSQQKSLKYHGRENRSGKCNWLQSGMPEQEALHQHFVHHQQEQMCPAQVLF